MNRADTTRETLGGDPRVFWIEDVLRYSDMDANAHVNNAAFVVLCESGRVAYFREHVPSDPESYFVIVRLEVDFRRESTYPGRIATATWLTRLGNSSLGLRQALFDGEGHLLATSSATCVVMAKETRRPRPINGNVRAILEPLVRPDAPEKPPPR